MSSPWRAGQVRLARDLLVRAMAALRVPSPPAAEVHHRVLAALQPFLEDPRPAGYLASCRELRDLGGQAEQQLVLRSRARLVERSLAALRALPGVPAATVDRLVASGPEVGDAPVDAGTRVRLQVLEALLAAHQELASRAEAASLRLRESLAPRAAPAKPAPAPRPRRPAGRPLSSRRATSSGV